MLSCWNESVPNRPSFANLQTELDRLLSAEGSSQYIDFSINPNDLCYQVDDENDTLNNHLRVALPGANRRSSRLERELSPNISRSSSKSFLQDSPTSSIGADMMKSGSASPTLEKPQAMNPLSFLSEKDSGRRPRSMMLLRNQSPSQKLDEDRSEMEERFSVHGFTATLYRVWDRATSE